MALGKNRLAQFARGLGNIEVCQKLPTPSTTFQNVGYIESSVFGDIPKMEEFVVETGDLVNILRNSQRVSLKTNLTQSGIDEIGLLRNAAPIFYAMRYHGKTSDQNLYQYLCFEICKILPILPIAFGASKRIIPMEIVAIFQDELSFAVPPYYVWQGNDLMFFDKLQFFIDPMLALNSGTTKILDISGNAYHGTLSAAINTIWNAGGFLRFDGTNDSVNFGDILDDDGVSDFIIDGWVRIQKADGNALPIFAKKNGVGTSAGYGIYRTAGNKIQFSIADGATQALIVCTTSTLQNVWTHVGVVVTRNGNAQMYLNGVADGAAVSVAGIGNAANALNLLLGADNAAKGQIDGGAFRNCIYGATSLPSNSATIMAKRFNSERTKYGV